MKRKVIILSQENSIECDNKDCDYHIKHSDYVEKNILFFVNKPCPKCGENLLTTKDYIDHLKLMRAVNWINKWFSWTMYLMSKKAYQKRVDKAIAVGVKVHNGIKIETNEQEN